MNRLLFLFVTLLLFLSVTVTQAAPWPNADPSGPWPKDGAAASTPTPHPPKSPPTDSMIAYYSFNEGGGSVVRDAAKGNHFSAEGTYWRTRGINGGAMHLHNASLSAYNQAYLDLRPGNFTIEFAVRYAEQADKSVPREFIIGRFLSQGICREFYGPNGCESFERPFSGWSFRHSEDPAWGFAANQDQFQVHGRNHLTSRIGRKSPTIASDHNWHQIKITYDEAAKFMALFIDNKQVDTLDVKTEGQLTDQYYDTSPRTLGSINIPTGAPLVIKGNGFDVDEFRISQTPFVPQPTQTPEPTPTVTAAQSTPEPPAAATAELMHHYRFVPDPGNKRAARDETGRQWGMLLDSAVHRRGVVDNAVNFGASGRVYVAHPYKANPQFSVSFWYRAYSYDDKPFILERAINDETFQFRVTEDANELRIVSGGFGPCVLNFAKANQQSSATDRKWHHIAFSYDLSSPKVNCYRDGKLFDSTTRFYENAEANFVANAPLTARGKGFEMDELRLYDGILTKWNVQNLFENP